MEIDDIRKLVELMEERGVVELEMEDGKGKVRLVRENHRAPAFPAFAPSPPPAPALPVTVAAPTLERPAEPVTGATITSPMVGTFYRAPSPDAKPYVDVGTVVEKDDVVCIIEAMKMMNEIRAEMRGRVRKILVENSQPVEYDQPLFLLEPL
ncbi:MAG TPA: acetyl-CoA carboxylase biotin carboxyl carrier protein [Candidatus Binatia bacterium]|jgi:acetyl-CoA carboxylase biotin carboxyl carrier protein|nr:acetyl-CoA carboxylase biotin carboxyl carrier protein [Candidatus Binatia bacterium]